MPRARERSLLRAEECEPGDGGARRWLRVAPEPTLETGAGGATVVSNHGTAGRGDGAKRMDAKLDEEREEECEAGDGGVGRWLGSAAPGVAFPEHLAFCQAFPSALTASATLCS